MSYSRPPYSKAGITVIQHSDPKPPDSLNIHGVKRVWIEKHEGDGTRWVTIGFQDYENKYHKFDMSVFGDREFPQIIEVEKVDEEQEQSA